MLIIPLFNIGKEKYNSISKFFVKINNKFLIEYCLQSIDMSKEILLFIIGSEDCITHNIDKILKKLYSSCLIKIIENSSSVLDTLYQSRKLIRDNEKIIIFAPPFTYFQPKFNLEAFNQGECFLLLFKSNNPNHCYVKIDNNKIIEIKEKSVIGNYALLGLYVFKNKEKFFKYFPEFNLKNKLYISDIVNCFLKNNINIEYNKSELVYPFKDTNHIDYIKNKVIKYNYIFGISSDHSGFKSKIKLIDYLDSKSIKYIDYGCYTDNDCDYQDYISNQYIGFHNYEFNFGLSFCRSGQGVNISANHTGFFSALVYDKWAAQMAIEHNNCNFLCLSERLLEKGIYNIEEIIEIIFKYKFWGGRFLDRLLKIENN